MIHCTRFGEKMINRVIDILKICLTFCSKNLKILWNDILVYLVIISIKLVY